MYLVTMNSDVSGIEGAKYIVYIGVHNEEGGIIEKLSLTTEYPFFGDIQDIIKQIERHLFSSTRFYTNKEEKLRVYHFIKDNCHDLKIGTRRHNIKIIDEKIEKLKKEKKEFLKEINNLERLVKNGW